MPQSFLALHYHFVFSTKNRSPAITSVIRPRLNDYLGGLVRAEGGTLLACGGMPDHVHMLARLSQLKAVADVLRVVKTNSSKWVGETFPDVWWPGWQAGYGGFTVSTSGLAEVKAYIANQEEHHRTRTFEDEFRALLVKHGVEFDERRLWD